MLTHPTYDQLNQLALFGMAKAFIETEDSAQAGVLTYPEWLALLLGREMAYRSDKKLAARLRHAKLRQQALVEDVDYRADAWPRPSAHSRNLCAATGSTHTRTW